MGKDSVVIYARYSSSAQRDCSIDQQIKVCRAYADKMGFDVVAVYEDHALTGTNDHRPGFQRMIADAPGAGWSYVLVYSLDRFSRDRYDSAVNKKRLQDAGVRVLSATEQISDGPSGILVESLLEGIAEYYSAELRAKTRRGMLDNAEHCRVNGPLPPGYQKGPDGCYQIDPAEAAAIRELYDRTLAGEHTRSILDDYKSRGLCRRNGRPWTRNMFYLALSREIYTGVYIYGDIRVEGGVPQIIDPDTFQRVQQLIGSKKNPRQAVGVPSARRRENGIFALTGKLFCGQCRSPMVGTSGHGKSGRSYHYYTCKGHRAGHGCQLQPVRRDQIEYAVTEALVRTVLADSNIPILADACMDHLARSADQTDAAAVEGRLAETRTSLANLLQALERGIFSDTVQQRLQELETEEKQLTARLSELHRRAENQPTREDVILTLMMFKDGDLKDPTYRAAILDTFLVRAYVYPDQLKLVFHVDAAGGVNELDLPIDFDPADLPDALGCSDNGCSGSPIQLIRTQQLIFSFAVSRIGEETHL